MNSQYRNCIKNIQKFRISKHVVNIIILLKNNNEKSFDLLKTKNLIDQLNREKLTNSTIKLKRFYICIMCNNAFIKNANLIKHIKKNYNTNCFFYYVVCERKFKRKNYLKKHFVIYIKNLIVVFERVISKQKNRVLTTKFYFQYLTNSTIQNVFFKFVTMYNHIFSKTLCSFCNELLIDIDVQ